MPLLQVNHLKKVYTTRFGGNKVEALRDIHFTVEQGEYTAIMGESGSGKTTLLNLLASVDRPTDGEILLKILFPLKTAVWQNSGGSIWGLCFRILTY